ncbi:DAN domain family member 5 [Xenentodon cancila]
MAILVGFVFLSSWAAAAAVFPYHSLLKEPFQASGSGPEETVQGTVKVVQLDPRVLTQSGFFRRGLAPRRAHSSRLPFPAFLSRGRPGQAQVPRTPVSPLHNLSPKSHQETELKKKQGLHMWQRVTDKGGKMSLPVSLKDTKQTCTAVSFSQRVTADGCRTVTVHNKLCFGQCSSLFIPPEGEYGELSPGTTALRRRAPCSRCSPVKAHFVTVPLQCGVQVREKRVMVVEECKCETSRDDRSSEAELYTHM